jgi:hypothetical protein
VTVLQWFHASQHVISIVRQEENDRGIIRCISLAEARRLWPEPKRRGGGSLKAGGTLGGDPPFREVGPGACPAALAHQDEFCASPARE